MDFNGNGQIDPEEWLLTEMILEDEEEENDKKGGSNKPSGGGCLSSFLLIIGTPIIALLCLSNLVGII